MRTALAAALIAAAPVAHAQDPAHDPACATVRVALPAELAGWSDQMPVAAGTEPGGGASVSPGQAVLVSLHPAKHLSFAKEGAAATGNGGALTLTIAAAGTYRVALGGTTWVDVVRAGNTVTSTAHGHGPKCSGVRKMVDFALEPGSYTVQLSGSEAESVALLVAKLA